jgi:Uma2 family endonuclease
MAMAVTARRFTVDEVLAWPEDGNRYELVDGVLLVTPAPVPVHQVVAQRLAAALAIRSQHWPDLYVASPGEILIRPDTRMEPDVLVFCTPSLHRKWEEIREHWLAVEVWSPSSVIYDREVKRDAYLQIGVREVWLVDCARKVVLVSKPGAVPDVVHGGLLPWRPPAAPEPAPIDLAEVFRGVDSQGLDLP